MTASKRVSLTVAGVVLCAGGILWAFSAAPVRDRAADRVAAQGPALFGFAGSASCSGRACHGGDAPVKDPDAVALQNEYTQSVMYDKHTRAYQVLLGDQAQRISKNLAPTNKDQKAIPAHEDVRCLACHSTPEAAWPVRDGSKPDLATLNWQKAGVSCEACHGPAVKDGKGWLLIHTSASEWRSKLKPGEKEAYGYMNLAEVSTTAHVCVGCHVGAPADEKNKIPARDCNHDIMAAGHPRLNFELATYVYNMPPHWNVEKKKRDLGEKLPIYEANVWSVGRVVAARAALEQLVERTRNTTRWPEFAEYRCYSCHTTLSNNWAKFQNEPGRSRGTIPYDSWYSTLLPSLNPNLKDGYAKLSAEMAKPTPDAAKVKEEAEALIEVHSQWLKGKHDTEPANLLVDVVKDVKGLPRSWEDATQLTLAIGLLKRDVIKSPSYQQILKALAFPAGGEGPQGVDGPAADQKTVQDAFTEVLKSLR